MIYDMFLRKHWFILKFINNLSLIKYSHTIQCITFDKKIRIMSSTHNRNDTILYLRFSLDICCFKNNHEFLLFWFDPNRGQYLNNMSSSDVDSTQNSHDQSPTNSMRKKKQSHGTMKLIQGMRLHEKMSSFQSMLHF